MLYSGSKEPFCKWGVIQTHNLVKCSDDLAVSRALRLISLLLVHTYPEEVSLSGCQEVDLAQGWRGEGAGHHHHRAGTQVNSSAEYVQEESCL